MRLLGNILSTCLISSETAEPCPGVAVPFAFQSSMRLAFPYAPRNLTADLKTADLVSSETQVSGSKGCRGDLIHKFCLSTLTCPSYLNDWHRVLIFVLPNLEFLPNWKMVWKWWALFKNTVRQTNNPQSPWAKRWQLRHMLKDWEKRMKSFFGKLGDSKVPLILGNLESHKNAQAWCILSKDLRRPKVFNSGWFPGSEVASEG